MRPEPRSANPVEALSQVYNRFNPKPSEPRPVGYSREGIALEVVKVAVSKFITDHKNDPTFQDEIKKALHEIVSLPRPTPSGSDEAELIEAQPLSEEQAYDILERFMGECVTQPPQVVVDTVEADQASRADDQSKIDQNPSLVTPQPTAPKLNPKVKKDQADPNEINSNPGYLSTESTTWVLDAVQRIYAEVTSDNQYGDPNSIVEKNENEKINEMKKEASVEAEEGNQATTIPRPEPQPQAKHQEKAKPEYTAKKFIEHTLEKGFKDPIKDAMSALKL